MIGFGSARRLANSTLSRVTNVLSTLSEAPPPKNNVGGVLANRLGLQPGRLLLSSLAWHARSLPCEADPGILADLYRDGIAIREQFFPTEVFARLQMAIEAWSERARQIPNKDGYGVDWSTGSVQPDAGGPGSVINDIVASAQLERLAAAYMRRPIPSDAPGVHYQQLSLPLHQTDNTDINGVLHSDRHFHTIKIFLHLADIEIEDGPFVYALGSHRTTLQRVQHEYDVGVRLARAEAGADLPPELFMKPNRALVTEEKAAALNLLERPICAPKNTLIVCDTRGFHRRGNMSPGRTRSTLRFIFHGLERPWYAPPSSWLRDQLETQVSRVSATLGTRTWSKPRKW